MPPIAGQCYIDEHIALLEERLSGGETMEGGGLLTYLLTNTKMTREQIYINITELLLSGVDTVCGPFFLPISATESFCWLALI